MRTVQNAFSAVRSFFVRDQRGVSAVEFAMVSPLFFLTLAFTVDFASVLFARFALNESLAAGANYALINGDRANSASGEALAEDIGRIIVGGVGGARVDGQIVVNNGVRLSLGSYDPDDGGFEAPSGGNATDACYCPSGVAGALDWGSSMQCGIPCEGGGTSGRFIQLNISRPHNPMLLNYGLLDNDRIPVATVVRVQ